MSLLLPADRIAERRAITGRGLEPLATSLRAALEPLIAAEPFIPREKAVLSKRGGRCSRDGERLEFDPASPRAHRCRRCGSVERDEAHYLWWVMSYQLWLAERAVHGAALGVLTGDAACSRMASGLLERYAEIYLAYPNRDNVLGPSRPFFSTYLESIWLLQICVALDLLEEYAPDAARGSRIRERVIAPSLALIASYDEGASNRQVWNNAAIIAAGSLLDSTASVERAREGPSGLLRHMTDGLLSDGTWYEGENYHLFAHRGLWYGVTMSEVRGMPLPAEPMRRFMEGFATPFLTALPDFTFPARRDSPHAVSLRQWRFAELCELGLGRGDDPRLISALAVLYGTDLPRGPTGRDRSAADVEENGPAGGLDRSDQGWRALLVARDRLPDLERTAQPSVLLEGQGLAVFRRERGRVYAALDYGHTGGGHGHPDRLGIILVDGAARWLDDPGTGSYVDRSLHWYRSTLAHNAPLIDGVSQARVPGRLLAYDERGDIGWIEAAAHELAPGVTVTRTLVVLGAYVIDEVRWSSRREVTVDLPLHIDAEVEGIEGWRAGEMTGGSGLEDGFDFLRDTVTAAAPAGVVVGLRATEQGRTLRAWLTSSRDADWWRASAPGAPGAGARPFLLWRAGGVDGLVRGVWALDESVALESMDESGCALVLAGGVRHVHTRSGRDWRISVTTPDRAPAVIRLGEGRAGSRRGDTSPLPDAQPRPQGAAQLVPVPRTTEAVASGEPLVGVVPTVVLGEGHYRRSEQSWQEAGRPEATVRLAALADALIVDVSVPRSCRLFAAAGASNPFDNESPDVNGDGVQVYLTTAEGATPSDAGWMLVPEAESRAVRVRPIGAVLGAAIPPTATWWPTADGYQLRARVPLGAGAPRGPARARIDLIVNETAPGRARRRGQLVLSGARGEWAYLRGDRHDSARGLDILIL